MHLDQFVKLFNVVYLYFTDINLLTNGIKLVNFLELNEIVVSQLNLTIHCEHLPESLDKLFVSIISNKVKLSEDIIKSDFLSQEFIMKYNQYITDENLSTNIFNENMIVNLMNSFSFDYAHSYFYEIIYNFHIFRLFFEKEEYESIGQTYSVIGAWAWGLSRGLDYLQSDKDIASERVAVHGHSRLGKTSLWAGAIDRRFKMVISNNSGCGGGALHKRKIGENLSQHFKYHTENCGVPCWFVDKLEQFIWHEELLPMDQHELMALIAPRPLAIATATEDYDADPKGEFLACKAASEVYALFGSKGLEVDEMPAPDVNISGDISFHLRTGKHDQTPQDWAHYLDLADRYL